MHTGDDPSDQASEEVSFESAAMSGQGSAGRHALTPGILRSWGVKRGVEPSLLSCSPEAPSSLTLLARRAHPCAGTYWGRAKTESPDSQGRLATEAPSPDLWPACANRPRPIGPCLYKYIRGLTPIRPRKR